MYAKFMETKKAVISMSKLKQSISSKIVFCISVIILLIWLFPYLFLISSAFKPSAEVISIPARFFPTEISIENFIRLFDTTPVLTYISNSFITAIVSTIIAVALGSLSAYAIARSRTKASTFLLVLILCLRMIPSSSIAVPIFDIIINLGLYDTRMALIIVYAAINMPFVMWVMLGFYEGIPTSLDEAACVDGASSFKTFYKIILPISLPGIATSAIFTVFLAWNDFLMALLLTGREAKTFTVGLSEFLSAYSLDLGPMAAGALVFSLPVMVLSMVAQKYIIGGLTSGSVK